MLLVAERICMRARPFICTQLHGTHQLHAHSCHCKHTMVRVEGIVVSRRKLLVELKLPLGKNKGLWMCLKDDHVICSQWRKLSQGLRNERRLTVPVCLCQWTASTPRWNLFVRSPTLRVVEDKRRRGCGSKMHSWKIARGENNTEVAADQSGALRLNPPSCFPHTFNKKVVVLFLVICICGARAKTFLAFVISVFCPVWRLLSVPVVSWPTLSRMFRWLPMEKLSLDRAPALMLPLCATIFICKRTASNSSCIQLLHLGLHLVNNSLGLRGHPMQDRMMVGYTPKKVKLSWEKKNSFTLHTKLKTKSIWKLGFDWNTVRLNWSGNWA